LVSGDIASLFLIKDETIRKRARHAITEHERVKKSVHALKKNDLIELGRLLNASHASLKDDFQVSCDELDFIVAELQSLEFCIGARMTGAGFGGCCIALVKADSAETISKRLIAFYENRFGFAPSVYPCNTSDGVHAITT
jgi:galactokinase